MDPISLSRAAPCIWDHRVAVSSWIYLNQDHEQSRICSPWWCLQRLGSWALQSPRALQLGGPGCPSDLTWGSRTESAAWCLKPMEVCEIRYNLLMTLQILRRLLTKIIQWPPVRSLWPTSGPTAPKERHAEKLSVLYRNSYSRSHVLKQLHKWVKAERCVWVATETCWFLIFCKGEVQHSSADSAGFPESSKNPQQRCQPPPSDHRPKDREWTSCWTSVLETSNDSRVNFCFWLPLLYLSCS